jgi:hypothetical protein
LLFVFVGGFFGFFVFFLFVFVGGFFGFFVFLLFVLFGGLLGFARSLIARLQVSDLRLVVTVGVLFLLDVTVLGRYIACLFLRVGFLGLLFVRFWAEG